MPKNVRIFEKVVGENSVGQTLWDKVIDITTLEVDDHIRIFEDKQAKEDGVVMFEGFVLRKPWYDEKNNIAEFQLESLAEREAKLAKDKLTNLTIKSAESDLDR